MRNIQYQTDHKIVSMIAHDQANGWEYLYEKYSSSMYGIVFIFAKSKSIADDVFFHLFLHLKNDKEILITQNVGLCSFLMEETVTFIRNELKRKGLDADISDASDLHKLRQLLCAKYWLPIPTIVTIDGNTIKKTSKFVLHPQDRELISLE